MLVNWGELRYMKPFCALRQLNFQDRGFYLFILFFSGRILGLVRILGCCYSGT
ncbi:hypothetical protein BDV36DRAFT_278349 [Aspergillus pseudocaelatus]|uniref:Uncharacterized protein n=1 Tax=Aspergillus pseudocaelatus TaxID=1825620 RepID=A0ABQ6W106_9EURO|nr:hypothetical protein BDV36DRAFT_278349 [Aspergillus pseudocaelatus]